MDQEKLAPVELKEEISNHHVLLLYNDDFNTFEHVIECLVDVCKHTYEQAEQCAWITHLKGKCDILTGSKQVLMQPLKELTQLGLSVVIE